MAMWINVDDVELRACEGKIVIGAIGFLVSVNYLDTGGARHYLRDTPARALRSREPRLSGDCGTSNNVLTYAHGLHVISGVNRSYSRVLVSKVATEQACEWLENEGWISLADTLREVGQ